MKHGKLLANAVSTMMEAWGSDAPPECFWVLTEMIQFINAETGSTLDLLDSEELSDLDEEKYKSVIAFLNSDACNNV